MIDYIHPEHIVRALSNLPQLVLEVTDACNLKCKYCAYGELYEGYDKRHNRKMSFDMVRRIIDYLYPLWTSKYNTSSQQTLYISFYGGEPLMNMPLIEKVVDYMEGLRIPHRTIRFSMTTNAILLDRYMDFIVEHDFSLLVSLDGNRRNDSYRVDHSGNPSFDRVVCNIDLLKERHPDYFRRSVNFNSVFHNRSSVEDVYSFIKERYDKIPSISDLNNVGIKPDKKDEFERMFQSSTQNLNMSGKKDEIKEALSLRNPEYRTLTLFLKQHSGFAFEDYTDLLFEKGEPTFIPTGTCLPFTRKLYLSVNGKILPCERIGQQFGLGEVTDTEVRLDPALIANKCNERLARMEVTCKACYNKKACSQCMYNLEGIDEKPKCKGFMDKKAFQAYSARNMLLISQRPSLYREIMTKVFSS